MICHADQVLGPPRPGQQARQPLQGGRVLGDLLEQGHVQGDGVLRVRVACVELAEQGQQEDLARALGVLELLAIEGAQVVVARKLVQHALEAVAGRTQIGSHLERLLVGPARAVGLGQAVL